jgi:simple sugar transport system ATP-binding protein
MSVNQSTSAPGPDDLPFDHQPGIGAEVALGDPGADASPTLVVRSVTKRFGRVVANDKLDLRLDGGRVHGLLGENGAGKSTIIKMLGGIYRPDEGEILLGGAAVTIGSPYDASLCGIEIVHQESILIPALTIAENIALRRRIRGRLGGALLAEFARVARDLGFHLDPQVRVAELSIGARQRADIVIAMMGAPRVLILDEPTPIMGPEERDAFFALVRRLASQGSAVVLVTHRLREAFDHCDDITVLRNGRNVASWTSSDFPNEGQMLDAMIGSGGIPPLSTRSKMLPAREGVPALGGRDIIFRPSERLTVRVEEFEVWPGEIVGVAGIEGSGQRELAGLLVGQLAPELGDIQILGRNVGEYTERELCGLVGDVPDEPSLGTAGDLSDLSVWQNLGFPTLLWKAVGPGERRRLRASAEEAVGRFNVKAPDGNTLVDHLSGGNKRRVVLARETFIKSPRVLVLTYASRGLDARAGAHLLRHVQELAEQGAAVVFISSDLDELLSLCHRISVIVDGRLAGPIPTSDLDQVTLAGLMLGLTASPANSSTARDEGAMS